MRIAAYNEIQLNNSVIALGKFQALHKGHLLLVNKVVDIACEKELTSVICSIDFNNKEQIFTNEERYEFLDKKGIDVVARCEFNQEFASITPESFFIDILVGRFGAKYVVVGSDFCFGYKRRGNVETLKTLGRAYNVEIIIIEKLSYKQQIISTSYIKELIGKGKVDVAYEYLGRPYSISGIVCHGKQLGNTIGFPTVNIIPDGDKLLPKTGVYQSKVIIDGVEYKSMTNVGFNPTVSDKCDIIIETHILNYDGNLYDRKITIELIKYIRNQIKFNSLDDLIKQLNSDKEVIMHQ